MFLTAKKKKTNGQKKEKHSILPQVPKYRERLLRKYCDIWVYELIRLNYVNALNLSKVVVAMINILGIKPLFFLKLH